MYWWGWKVLRFVLFVGRMGTGNEWRGMDGGKRVAQSPMRRVVNDSEY